MIIKYTVTLILVLCFQSFAANDSLRLAAIRDTVYQDSLTDAVVWAANTNDVETIRIWLDTGGKINALNKYGAPLLFHAANGNAVNVARLVLERGGDVSYRTPYGSPFFRSIWADRFDVFKLFLKHNPDLSEIGRQGYSPLHQAAISDKNLPMTKLLIDAGADLYIHDSSGCMPIHLAARKGCFETLKLFLDQGMKVDQPDKYGLTVLHHAFHKSGFGVLLSSPRVMLDNWNIINFLLESGADLKRLNYSHHEILFYVVQFDNLDLLKRMVENGADINVTDPDGMTVINQAAHYNAARTAEYLLDNGASIDHADKWIGTPLTIACLKQNYQIVKLLLEHGVDVNYQIPDPGYSTSAADFFPGFSPLHFCARNNNTQIAELLLSYGADLNPTAQRNHTPLYMAILLQHDGMFDLLINAGADPNITNSWRKTPLHLSVERGRIDYVQKLLLAGGRLNIADLDQRYPIDMIPADGENSDEMLKLLKAHHGDINQPIQTEKTKSISPGVLKQRARSQKIYVGGDITPLLRAVLDNDSAEVVRILELGGDPNYRDFFDRTVLHNAIEKYYLNIVNLLLDAGAEVNVRNSHGITPLCYAVLMPSYSMVSKLIELGADVNARSYSPEFSPDHWGKYRLHQPTMPWYLSKEEEDSIKTIDGYPPLSYLFSFSKYEEYPQYQDEILGIIQLFVDNDAEINRLFKTWYSNQCQTTTLFEKALRGGYIDEAELLLENGAIMEHPSSTTPMLIKVLFYEKEEWAAQALELLLHYDFDPNVRDEYDNTPLYVVCQNVRVQGPTTLAKILIKNGANVRVRCKNNETPLHQATYRGYHEIMKALVEAGANPRSMDSSVRSPIGIAEANKDTTAIKILMGKE